MNGSLALPCAPRPARRGAQHGLTLVSLLVGLIISMILIVATLMLFQNMARITATARGEARTETLRSAAFLGADMALQGAGYGLAAAQIGTHLLVLPDASLDADGTLTASAHAAAGNAVVWAQAIDGSTRCQALLSPAAGGLLQLHSAENCADATDFGSLTWTPHTLIPAQHPAIDVTFSWAAQPCSPFGIVAAPLTDKVQLTLSTAHHNGVPLATSLCLSNLAAEESP